MSWGTPQPDWLTPGLSAALTEARLPQNKDGMLMLWERKQRELTELKELEMDYRKVCTKFLIATVPTPKEGVNNIDLGNGYTAKATIKLNYKLDSDNEKVEAALDALEKLGNDGSFVADRLVTWKAILSVTEYKKLMEDANTSELKKQQLNAINNVVTIDEGAPTLKIEEPKGKK